MSDYSGLPNQPDSNDDPASTGRLEGVVTRWNARANGAYLELVELLGAAQDDFEGLSALLSERHDLAPTLLPGPQADLHAAMGALENIEKLEDGLADIHIELQTMHAQIRRCIGAGEKQRGDLAPLTAGGAVMRAELAAAAKVLGIVPKTAREGQLTAQVDSLRAELSRVKEELSDARAQATAAKNTPQVVHTEIARLRARVLDLMARDADRPLESRGDLSLQYERILSQAHDDEGRRRRMGEILVSAGVITDKQLDAALEEQRTAWNRHLGAVLVELGYVSEDTVAQALAAQIKVPYVRLIHEVPKSEALALLSRALAHHHTCVPLRFERDVLVVAMANPMDLVAIDDIELATRRTIKPVVASASEIKGALKRHYR